MRTQIRQQLLEMTDSMLEAAKTLDELYRKKEYAQFKELLGIVQEAALTVGNKIEETEGEGTAAVSQLENLCELVWGLYENVETENPQKRMKLMNKQLLQIRNSIKYDIPVTYEVVFLPYKASMWDSLESIWMAAKEAPDCNCRVIPIPYFDRKPDGTPRNWYDESGEFPGYVPITKYTEYHLETERPDIIFIHNPYDQFNIVTTVHPLFYASRIKDYTEKLVYIPYFVHQNDIVAEHYCVLPGTIYADVVILQSEKVREQYLRYYEAALPELVEKQGREAIEKKFQALGSPKFDVSADSQNDIPEEWREFLGQGKKVIFFNTHLRGLMQGKSEQFLRKLEWVFNFFQKQEDVVLLWRPHPLMVETARAMNPEAVEPYLKLVERYRRQKIGIYDDSRELHRAIDLSDAYYGSGSSVVELFRQQGKPVMLMSEQIRED